MNRKATDVRLAAIFVALGLIMSITPVHADDDTKPGSISNLVNPARGTSWLYFEWENPPDKDYDGAIVHLNGKRLVSLPGDYLSWKWRKRDKSIGTRTIPSYTALDLRPGTEYTFTVRTKYPNGVGNAVSLKASTRPIPDRTPVRGNNVKEEGEVCDGYDLGGHAPPTIGKGFTGGTLKSKPDCSGFDTSECVVGKKIKAASSEYADVLAAVEKASVGDIVVVPEGNSTWEAPLVIKKGITLRGAGIDKTVIMTSHVGPRKQYIIIVIAPPTDVYVRVTGFTFNGNAKGEKKALSGRGIIVSAGKGRKLTQFRIDHNKFINFDTRGTHKGASRAVICPGWLHGVVDHNQFINCTKSVDPHGRGNPGWKRPIALGTANRVFIEDNLFLRTRGGVTSCGGGGRYTFRYNIVGTASAGKLGDPMDAHGNQMRIEGQKNLGQEDFVPGQGHHRGTVSVEIYNNKFYSENLYRFMSIRGGTGVIFNNVMNCKKKRAHGIHFWEEESFRFAAWKHHYPGWDQINNFHVWGNTNNDEPANGAVVFARDRYYIQENRDYFHRSPNRETDMHYGYKPFTYPHPMTRMTPDDN